MKRLASRYKEIGTAPIESANIKVTSVNDLTPQIVKHFATIDSLSFEVKDFSNSVQRGEMVMLELITKDCKGKYYPRGGCEVTVQLESSLGEMISADVTDYNDGTYIICFAAQQVGEIKLSVSVNGHEIKESPLKISVHESSIKPSKIITSHDDSFGQLWGIACSNNGTWAVADWINNCVHVFDSQDKPIKKFGTRVAGMGSFSILVMLHLMITINCTSLIVIITECKSLILVVANYLLQFGGKGAGKGKLKYPIGITAHSNKVYVADRQNNRISVFQDDGKYFSVIGQQRLSQYFDLSIDTYSELVVADWKHHCIYTFTLDGQCTNTFTATGIIQLREPYSVTTDSDGLILIADTCNHTLLICDEVGNCIYCFGSQGSDEGEFNHPHGIAVAPNGNIYINDTCNKRIQIFSNRLI